ncbi:MAG: pallilysin-related adhesin [Treponema sp.]|jgi:hypothetical protein|nr:pallilysin-related adhesin [Treponema sp.]
MTRRNFKVFTILVFMLTALGIGTLLFLPNDFFSPSNREVSQTRVVIPQNTGLGGSSSELLDSQNFEEGSAARVSFAENESVISIITRDFDGDSREEQIVAYRNPQEIDTPIFITYVEFDEKTGQYSRAWTAPTAAARQNSLILYSEDLVGDGGICVLVSGMNGAGEQTLTVFRKNGFTPESVPEEAFGKIAEFIIEGSIAVEEVRRSQDYQQGTRGQSLTISTYGRDYESSNLLDQIETTYTYNPVNGLYEQSRVLKIPGRQIEQRRVSELLSSPGSFEEFIDGLWSHTMDNGENQYVYFNTANSEVIFYINNTEEIFTWQESNPTRYGLHIIGRNISLTKLRCTINIELESLDSIRLRVFQDAYLRTGPGAVWDGSYRKVQSIESALPEKRTAPYTEAAYRGEDGGIVFFKDGSYELFGAEMETAQKGKYVFFNMRDGEFLELRPSEPEGLARITFRISRGEETITMTRIRIGTRGIQEIELPVTFAKSG